MSLAYGSKNNICNTNIFTGASNSVSGNVYDFISNSYVPDNPDIK